MPYQITARFISNRNIKFNNRTYNLERMTLNDINAFQERLARFVLAKLELQLKSELAHEKLKTKAFESDYVYKGRPNAEAFIASLEKEINIVKSIMQRIDSFLVLRNTRKVIMTKGPKRVEFQSIEDEEISLYYADKYTFANPQDLVMFLKTFIQDGPKVKSV